MTTLKLQERTEKAKALGAVNGSTLAQSLDATEQVYQPAGERVKTVLAIELLRIERELEDSLSWTHEGFCDCDQCLFELRRQRKLCAARQRVLSELTALGVGGLTPPGPSRKGDIAMSQEKPMPKEFEDVLQAMQQMFDFLAKQAEAHPPAGVRWYPHPDEVAAWRKRHSDILDPQLESLLALKDDC